MRQPRIGTRAGGVMRGAPKYLIRKRKVETAVVLLRLQWVVKSLLHVSYRWLWPT